MVTILGICPTCWEYFKRRQVITDSMHPWSSTSVDKRKEDTWGDTRVCLTHGLEMKQKPLQYPAVPAEMFFFSFSERCCSRKPDLLPQRLSLPSGEHIWPVGLICCQSPTTPRKEPPSLFNLRLLPPARKNRFLKACSWARRETRNKWMQNTSIFLFNWHQ